MLFNAKNGCLRLQDSTMDYISFGRGPRNLIILPGIGDGLKTAKGMALPFALMYRLFAKDFSVYYFSRRSPLPAGFSTRDMAKDVHTAMQMLNLRSASVIGVSMGGMIAQHLAADYPNCIDRLVLAVTCSRPNPILTAAVGAWTDLARKSDGKGLMLDSARRMYTEKTFRKMKTAYALAGGLAAPKSFDRFIVMASACGAHDAFDALPRIACPTLVIGGEKDESLGAQPSIELSERIPSAELKMYPEYGHALYEEARDFNQIVFSFLKNEHPA